MHLILCNIVFPNSFTLIIQRSSSINVWHFYLLPLLPTALLLSLEFWSLISGLFSQQSSSKLCIHCWISNTEMQIEKKQKSNAGQYKRLMTGDMERVLNLNISRQVEMNSDSIYY